MSGSGKQTQTQSQKNRQKQSQKNQQKEHSFKDYFNVYTFETELPGSRKKVEFKPLTTKEIKKLLTYEDSDDYSKIEEILDKVISLSVTDENFNIDDLYLQDRFSLLVDIRKKTKGESYEFVYNCSECSSQNFQSINLDDLEVNKLEPDLNIDNEIKIDDNVSINVGYITRGEEKEAVSNTEDLGNDADLRLNLLTQGIKSVNTPYGSEENLSFEDKKFIIDRLTIKKLKEITDGYENHKVGVNFVINQKCRQCKKEENIPIPLRNFFF